MMMTKQPITKKLRISAETAWNAIRNLDRLDVWFPFIQTCQLEGRGSGTLRYMTTAEGGEITDTIEEIDDGNRRLVYLRPVSPFPVNSYRGTVEVFSSYDGLAIVVWTIDFESKSDDAASIAEIVYAAISDGIDGMEKDLMTRGD